VCTFNATPHALKCPLLEPVLSFFDVCQGTCVGFTCVWAFLEAAQTVCNDGQECFVRHPVHTVAIDADGAVLEPNAITEPVFGTRVVFNYILVVRSTCPRLVDHENIKPVIRRVYFVVVNYSHIHL